MSQYVRLWVNDEATNIVPDHAVKTAECWRLANSLGKGTLSLCLVANSFVVIDSIAIVVGPLAVESLMVADVEGRLRHWYKRCGGSGKYAMPQENKVCRRGSRSHGHTVGQKA